MWIKIIIISILVLGGALCVFLADYKRTSESNVVIKVVLPVLISLLVALLIFFLTMQFGNPVQFIEKVGHYFGMDLGQPTPTPEMTSNPYVDPTFKQRTSKEFNYTIEVPSHFTHEGAEGQDTEYDFNLTSPDKRANIVFTARRIEGELPTVFTKKYFMDTYSTTPIYSAGDIERDGWYAVSVKSADGYVHYRKCIFTNNIVRMFTFSFPTDQEDIYIHAFDYTTYIERSFKQLYSN